MDYAEIVDADVRELRATCDLAIAQTPGAVVCSRSLTLMYPGRELNAGQFQPSPSVFGLRPVATNT